MDLEGFCLRLGYRFSDFDLLCRALTHSSHGAPHNERLEFLGDSVLNCAVALELYGKFAQLAEGDLHRLRANIVNDQSLAVAAKAFDLGSDLLLGEGELRSGGAQRPSILAGALEAVIGAVFLDGGFGSARAATARLLGGSLDTIDPAKSRDRKSTRLNSSHIQKSRMPSSA